MREPLAIQNRRLLCANFMHLHIDDWRPMPGLVPFFLDETSMSAPRLCSFAPLTCFSGKLRCCWLVGSLGNPGPRTGSPSRRATTSPTPTSRRGRGSILSRGSVLGVWAGFSSCRRTSSTSSPASSGRSAAGCCRCSDVGLPIAQGRSETHRRCAFPPHPPPPAARARSRAVLRVEIAW